METLLKLPALCFFIARAISPHYTRKLLNRAPHYTLPKPCMVTAGQESQEPPQKAPLWQRLFTIQPVLFPGGIGTPKTSEKLDLVRSILTSNCVALLIASCSVVSTQLSKSHSRAYGGVLQGRSCSAEPHRPDPGRRYIHGCARLMTKERALVGVPNVI